MTPQEITAFITFTANIISKDMSSVEVNLLADWFDYLSDTLYMLSTLKEKEEIEEEEEKEKKVKCLHFTTNCQFTISFILKNRRLDIFIYSRS